MTFRKLLIAITFLSIFAMASRVSMDTDSWWHLRTGQVINETRSIPKEDSFSYTRLGEDWSYPSAAWISQWAMFQLYELAGPAALNFSLALIVTGTFGIWYFSLHGGPFLRAIILILAAATSSVFWSARPHIASFLFFAIFLHFLEAFKKNRIKHLYWLPVFMLFWTNSHPGFALGYILLFIYLLDELFTQLGQVEISKFDQMLNKLRHSTVPHIIFIAFLLLLASSLNPSGPSILSYPFETLSIGILRDFIQEWQSPDFHDLAMLPFLSSLLLLFASLGFSKRKMLASEILLITVFTYMALMAGRNIALFALAIAPALSRHAEDVISRIALKINVHLRTTEAPTRLQNRLNFLILFLVLTLAIFKSFQSFDNEKNKNHFAESFPLEAIEYLSANPALGNLFNSYNWGGYLIWALPEYPVYIDGRTDLYNDELLSEWLSIISAEEGWISKLDNRNISLILMEDHWPLVSLLEANDWNLLVESKPGLLFAKK